MPVLTYRWRKSTILVSVMRGFGIRLFGLFGVGEPRGTGLPHSEANGFAYSWAVSVPNLVSEGILRESVVGSFLDEVSADGGASEMSGGMFSMALWRAQEDVLAGIAASSRLDLRGMPPVRHETLSCFMFERGVYWMGFVCHAKPLEGARAVSAALNPSAGGKPKGPEQAIWLPEMAAGSWAVLAGDMFPENPKTKRRRRLQDV